MSDVRQKPCRRRETDRGVLECDVVVNDPNVSREHAEVRPRGGSWVLTDLGSTNGSRLNGRQIDGSEVLKPGDEIELGTSRITFELE